MEDEADAEEEFGINKEAEKPLVRKDVPKPVPKAKNQQGDFIVTKFDVDATLNFKSKEEAAEKQSKNEGLELESDSDSGYGEEEEKEAVKDVIPEEPKKSECKYISTEFLEVKVLSKKEKKALEDAEFEALLGGSKPVQEETKESEKKDAPAEAGSNNAKNKKKKEKKK